MLSAALVLLLAGGAFAADAAQPEEGFVSLFDGKTLNGWKVGEFAQEFQVVDGAIVMECPTKGGGPAHLFYDGEVCQHNFKNFDLKIDVMTFPGANSGIYFHTKYQESGWPRSGLECQVNISHSDWRRSGSLYAVKDLTWGPQKPKEGTENAFIALPEPPIKDNVWYTQEIICQNGQVVVKLDGKTVIEYTVSDPDTEHNLPEGRPWQPRGTFAIQAHPPMRDHISKACFKNIRVKVLPD